MASVFDASTIKSLTLANRFIRSATGTNLATDQGEVTPEITGHIMELVEGGVGLIITGHANVHLSGRNSATQLGIYNDSHIPGLSQMVKKVHQYDGKIVAQLNHGGAQSDSNVNGGTLLSPSIMPETKGKFADVQATTSMTQTDIDEILKAFRDGAVRAKKAGFDGVQLHSAHGFLFSSFLSPFFNKRTDSYGGDVTNRTRIIVDAYEEVRKAVGEDYPVLIKMNATDFLDPELSREEAVEAAVIFDNAGFDSIELSGGTMWGLRIFGDINRTPCRNVDSDAYYLETARLLKQRVEAPIILTGGIKSFDVAERIIRDGVADYIGLCRPLIREPDLVNRWKSGDTSRSPCIDDNACLFKGGGKCYQI